METEIKKSRIDFMNIPVDVIDENNLETVLLPLMENGKSNQIVFLGFADFLKGRTSKSFRQLLNDAALVLPSSSIITGGIKFLFKKNSAVFLNYDFILKILNILEKQKKSIYIIGSTRKTIMTSEKNLKDSYPGLHLVGRSSSKYGRDMEVDITMAIKKSSPTLLLAGSGLKGKNFWLYTNRNKFNPGITLWSADCFEIFTGKKKRPSRKGSSRFFSRFIRSIIRPWRIFYLFPFLFYYINLLFYKIFKTR